MTHELLILRHGKSDWDAGTDDYHRPLMDRGKRGAQRMGIWLLQRQLLPDLIISSPAERALVTAQKLCKAAGMGDHQFAGRTCAGHCPEAVQGCGDGGRGHTA